jgi:hypothetical protein
MEGAANVSSTPSQPSESVQGQKTAAASPKGTQMVPEARGEGARNSGTPMEPNEGKSGGGTQNAGGVPSENSKNAEIGKTEGDPAYLWTVRIKGEDRKYDIRKPDQAEYVRRQLQKVDGADRALEESALTRKQAKQFFEALKSNPAGVLQAMGHNVDELAKNHLAQALRLEAMDPKDRAIMERDAKLAEYERAQREAKEAEDARVAADENQKLRAKWDKSISDELMKHDDIPPTPHTIALTAKYIVEARRLGYTDVMPADVIETVRTHYKKDYKYMFSKLPIQKALEYLPEDFMAKIRQYDIAKITDPSQAQFAKKPAGKPAAPQKRDLKRKGYTWKEYQQVMEERVRQTPTLKSDR